MKKKSNKSFEGQYNLKLPKPTIEEAQTSIWQLHDELHLVRKELNSVISDRTLVWKKIENLAADRDSLKALVDAATFEINSLKVGLISNLRGVVSKFLFNNCYALSRIALVIGILAAGILIGKSL